MTRGEFRGLMARVFAAVFLASTCLGVLPAVWRVLPALVVGGILAAGWHAARVTMQVR